MAKKSIKTDDSVAFDEVTNIADIAILNTEEPQTFVPIETPSIEKPKAKVISLDVDRKELINPLRNEKVEIRLVDKISPLATSTNKKHPMSNCMAEGATRTYCVPTQRNGNKVNILTNSEKAFFEDLFGLEPGAMNSTKKVDNYWDDVEVTLGKYGNILDLSDPYDYIKYKVLIANKSRICPSLKELRDHKLATYDYYICSHDDEINEASAKMSITMKCYKEYGKIEDDRDTMRVIIETIDGSAVAADAKAGLLQTKINDIIQRDPKLFYATITDEMLPYKVMVRRGIDCGIIITRGKDLYLRDGSVPLCGAGENPTFVNAAKYIASPRNQDILFAIQAKINK